LYINFAFLKIRPLLRFSISAYIVRRQNQVAVDIAKKRV